jgi:hypothetical protein
MSTFRLFVVHRLPSGICLEEAAVPTLPDTFWSFADGEVAQEAARSVNATVSAIARRPI